MKGQDTMEWVMTYGWVIMVVVIVMAILFSLGVFDPKTHELMAAEQDICERNDMITGWGACYQVKGDRIIKSCNIVGTRHNGTFMDCEDR